MKSEKQSRTEKTEKQAKFNGGKKFMEDNFVINCVNAKPFKPPLVHTTGIFHREKATASRSTSHFFSGDDDR